MDAAAPASGMRKLTVIMTCEATVTETWTYEVPADTDITGPGFDADDLLAAGTGHLISVKEEVHDERNRELVSVSWADTQPA
jgi:hypothetical protein